MNFTRIGMLLVCFLIGIAVFQLLLYFPISLPYNWNYLDWSHLGIIPLITILVSIIMAFMLFRRNHYAKRIVLAFAGLVLLFTFILFIIHFEENGITISTGITLSFTRLAINFNGWALLAVMVSSWVLSSFPFLWKTRTVTVIESMRIDYALLATSVMWLSPFLAELLVLLDWQMKGVFAEKVRGLVLGGNGLNDLLFILGFATLISTGLYALFATKITVWLASD